MENYKHINIERSLQELGTNVFSLKPSSEKLVYRICEVCNKEQIKKFRFVVKHGQTKCGSCSSRINAGLTRESRSKKLQETWRRDGHPRLGVKHTDEAKRKISENRVPPPVSDERKKELSEKMLGSKNPFFGKKHDEAARLKMSLAAKKRVKRGKDHFFYGKTFYAKHSLYTKLDGSVEKLKSGWEVKLATWLDENKIEWRYEEKFFPVTYEWNGRINEGTYIPDFFIGNEIWEVKGYFRKDARAKFDAFLNQYPDIKVKLLMKDDLRELGIKI